MSRQSEILKIKDRVQEIKKLSIMRKAAEVEKFIENDVIDMFLCMASDIDYLKGEVEYLQEQVGRLENGN